MKVFKPFIILFCLLFLAVNILAQKIGVVDTNYILNKIPEYQDAEARLNTQITTWQEEIKNLQSLYEQKRTAFDNEKVLLIGEELKQREKEVTDLEKNIKSTISLRFSSNGEIEKLRNNLTKPFQDQIWNAIRTISEKNGLGIVFDKSNDVAVIFLNKRFDYTEKVLNLLLKNKNTESKTNKK